MTEESFCKAMIDLFVIYFSLVTRGKQIHNFYILCKKKSNAVSNGMKNFVGIEKNGSGTGKLPRISSLEIGQSIIYIHHRYSRGTKRLGSEPQGLSYRSFKLA